MAKGKLIKRASPEYRQEAKWAGITGTVVLRGLINWKGELEYIHIKQPLGGGLDEAAIEAVMKWRYEPYKLEGTPVTVDTDITVNFRLDGN
jgi:protein TonB